MPSKKVTISQKIFIFLLITVGIVFILLQVYRSVREGFQTNTDTSCKDETINGRKIYLCGTKDEALSELNNMSDSSYDNTAVCYTDINSEENYRNDNFGIGSSNLPTKFYTCFSRPAVEIFDPTSGVKFPISELDDIQPESGIATLQTNCALYNGAFQTYFNSYIRTSSILGSVNTIGFSNIVSSMNVLSTVSTLKCVSADDKNNTLNPGGLTNTAVGVCNSISTGMAYFFAMSNDESEDSLKRLTSVIGESKNLLSNEIYTVLKPAFLNSGCVADSDMSNYMKVI